MALANTYTTIGMMSGTSLDGLDMACCTFTYGTSWSWQIHEAVTIPYPAIWTKKLQGLMETDAQTLASTHVEYGHYSGVQLRDFIRKYKLSPDFAASHGHTVFHQPQHGLTLQVGDGNAIAAEAGIPVVYDFRSLDVALGGQGAPLVPAGDRLLFSGYDYCLNLGGIGNISFESKNQRVAYDICPVNMILNRLANKLGRPFDKAGSIAASGEVNTPLLTELNALSYYRRKGVKTLGKEWFLEEFVPVFEKYPLSVEDQLTTAVEHVAQQLAAAFGQAEGKEVLVTGGGALNEYLISRVQAHTAAKLVIPGASLIHYKEALIFAFLGVLRWRGEINCLASVTGASRDSSCGVITS